MDQTNSEEKDSEGDPFLSGGGPNSPPLDRIIG